MPAVPGIWCRVILKTFSEVLDEYNASIFRVEK
jgi:hypothetical protein